VTPKQANDLYEQCLFAWETAAGGNRQLADRAINGIWECLKEIDEAAASAAFKRGLEKMRSG
jgi:hypothetical protein